MDTFLATLFLIICVLLIIVVLLQKGRGVGAGGLFGGGGGQSAFGTRTGDVFTWVTIVLTGVFLLLSVGTALHFRQKTAQVGQPFFSPQPRPIPRDTAINVTLQCPEPRAEIFYTMRPEGTYKPENDDPTRQSEKYETAVRVKPGTVLRARAYLPGWKESVMSMGVYPLEQEPASQAATTTSGPGETGSPATSTSSPAAGTSRAAPTAPAGR